MTTDMKRAVEKAVGYEFEPIVYEYTERDVSLYALGVGAPADWLDQDELRFVYELSSHGFQALPTFPVIYPSAMIFRMIEGKLGEIEYSPMMLVHGEQYLELKHKIPTSGRITCRPRVSAIYDKGSGILVVSDTSCLDEHGTEIAFQQNSMFIRGIGGFGGDRGPSGNTNNPPERPPDATRREQTSTRQALIYRLSGDINPLHADPAMAALGGFATPILHGLCTFGFAGRAVLKHFCDNDPSRFKNIRVRFANPVFPGETLLTEMWQDGDQSVIFRTRVVERDVSVLTNCRVELA